MRSIKIIALAIAAASIFSLASCSEDVCDVCRQNPPTHSINSRQKAELCDFCYQKAIQTETEADVKSIKETPFESLTQKQKNYIIIFTDETINGYDATNIDGLSTDEIRDKVLNEAAERYSKTVDQIKSIIEAHEQKDVTE